MVHFPPRSVWAWRWPSEAPDPVPEVSWELDHYTREAGEWHAYRVFCSPSGGEWEDEDDLDPTHLEPRSPSDERPACRVPKTWPQPHALTQDLRFSTWTRQPLSDSWFRYFPDLTDHSQPTPIPPSPEFWATDAEPLDDFLRAAAILVCAIEYFGSKPRKSRLMGPRPEVPTQHRFAALVWGGLQPDDVFRRMLVGVSPTVVTTRNGTRWRHEQEWRASSLLGMFAAMFMKDLTEGHNVRTCVACSLPFVERVHAAEYCSKECRWKAMKRRQRDKIDEAITLHRRGRSVAAIAKRLKVEKHETVDGWIRK